MSREERRAYRRMMKNADPHALPTPQGPARRKMEIRSQRRARARTELATEPFVTARFIWVTLAVAAVAGLVFFSVLWPSMPLALYAGIAAAVVAAGGSVAVRYARRRAAAAGVLR